jgi:hypothetical protein
MILLQHSKTLFSILIFALLLQSCKSEIEPKPEIELAEPNWEIVEDFLPKFDIINKLKILEGNTLYMTGMVNGTVGIFKLENNQWLRLTETTSYASDFCLYKGKLYYGEYSGLYRVSNGFKEKLTTNERVVMSLGIFRDSLYITGGDFQVGNNFYNAASFDGSEFYPLPYFVGGRDMLVLNDKLYFSSNPVTEYDGSSFRYLDIGGESNFTKDDNDNFYVALYNHHGTNDKFTLVSKYGKGGSTTIGNSLPCYPYKIQYFNNTLVLVGSDIQTSEGVSYYFSNNEWKKVKIPDQSPSQSAVHNIVIFNNKLIGVANSGQIVQFKKLF